MQTEDVLQLAAERGIIRAADLEAIGANRTLLPYLSRKGALRRVGRGAYALPGRLSEYETLLEAAIAVPHGIICLLSALQYHEITTQMPSEAWVAIERGRWRPTPAGIALRIVKFSGPAFSMGIEEHEADGVTFRVYSPAKTIVDCFKFRNRIGLDVAREALVDALAQKKATRDEIWDCARPCRMARVMRPYLEMVS